MCVCVYVSEEDASVSQLFLCDKFGLKITERSARVYLGCIDLNCNKKKGQMDAVLRLRRDLRMRGAEQSA